MRFKIYLEKYRMLGYEAQKDYELALYNKAVSAFWFSIEALLRYLLIRSGKTPPERPGPLISKFLGIIADDILKRKLRDLLNSLYARRREVDHRKKIADKDYASKVLNSYRDIIEIIARYFRMEELEKEK